MKNSKEKQLIRLLRRNKRDLEWQVIELKGEILYKSLNTMFYSKVDVIKEMRDTLFTDDKKELNLNEMEDYIYKLKRN